MTGRIKESQYIFIGLAILFIVFLFAPLIRLFISSLNGEQLFIHYQEVIFDKGVVKSITNSLFISLITGVLTTVLAFLLAYGIQCTNIHKRLKHIFELGMVLPMLLPTITYGFVIIYAFGKQGLLTKLFGVQFFDIYGFKGLLLGYVIYTLPIAFLMINDAFNYVDKKYIVVSKLMGDSWIRTFTVTIIRPMLGAIGSGFLLSFVLSFTDFGIPASVGGTYDVIATRLYHTMLGSIPDFNRGSVIAIIMLIPSAFGIVLLNYLDKLNFQYDQISLFQVPDNRLRDRVFTVILSMFMIGFVMIFMVMFITPFVENYPYDMTFTMKYVKEALFSNNVINVFKNSIYVAFLTAVVGCTFSYAGALISTRTKLHKYQKTILDMFATVTNSVPGMVLGLSYLFLFKGTDIKGTFFILVICNVIHFFATPYLMAKNALAKMNTAWEVTGQLMGDSWFKTIYRVVIPNSFKTITQMFSYYFIHGMITISAIIFLVTARTAVMTSKIKELQHYANFNEIFILSILIFITNLAMKGMAKWVEQRFVGYE